MKSTQPLQVAPATPSRREFLVQMAVIVGGVLFLPPVVLAQPSEAWISVGPASRFRGEGCTQVALTVGNEQAVLYVQENEGAWLVLSGSCTHLGCTVDWQAKSSQFLCPCHKGRYDRTGRNVSGPPPHPLPAFKSRVDEHGTLFVQLP